MRVLFVDDHAEFTASVVPLFLAVHDVVVVPTIAAARQQLAAGRFDVVLVDYDLDDSKGDELVQWLRRSATPIKVVGVSARDAGNEALRAAGADAICAKLQFATIESVVRALF